MRACCLCTWLLLLIIRDEADCDFDNGDVRLRDGDKPNNGRVEVYYDGLWGTICDDGWDIDDALVVCRSLGYTSATRAIGNAAFGPGSGPVMLDGVDCDGTESSLAFCKTKGWRVTDCQHSEDAGVECEDTQADKLYLLDYSSEFSATFIKLFKSKWLCDFHIHVVTADTSQNITFCTHRLILGLNNDADFLFRDNATSYTMQVEDKCFHFVEEFIRYLYSKKIEVGHHSALCIHQMATLYGVANLQEFCIKILAQLLPDDPTFETQTEFYYYAVSSQDAFLQDLCLQYLSWNCEAFTKSEMWTTVSVGLMEALLSRSDIVINSELSLLQAVENWIISNNSTTKPQTLENLLGMIRLPMILPENLFMEKINLTIHPVYEKILLDAYIQALQFHTIPFQMLGQYVNFSDSKYEPRIYTSSTWSYLYNRTALNSNNNYYSYNMYNYNQYVMQYSFQTPKHPSFLFTSQLVQWYASFYSSQQSCINFGQSCLFDNFPILSLTLQYGQDSSILYENKVVMICNDSYVSHVQNFKANFANVPPKNLSFSTFPCSSEYSAYRYTIRPKYVDTIS